jgi:hypothetical protein
LREKGVDKERKKKPWMNFERGKQRAKKKRKQRERK